MVDMIETPRLFVPNPMDGRYGIYRADKYNLYSTISNNERPSADDMEFYEFVSYYYSMDLDMLPDVRPYVQYVDFMQTCGGCIAATDVAAIKYLKRNCNTLIIPNAEERGFLEHMRANALRKAGGVYMFDYNKTVPSRFAHSNYVAQVMARFGMNAGR